MPSANARVSQRGKAAKKAAKPKPQPIPATTLTNTTGEAVRAVGEPGQSGEGFYQRIVGRKTGRPAPRPMGRVVGGELVGGSPTHERIMADHGLMDRGAADARQGQLFAPHELPQAETAKALALKNGVAPPLAASRPGFMPELYQSPGGGTATAKQAHSRMAGAVKRLGQMGGRGDAADQVASQIAAATHLAPGKWSEDALAEANSTARGPVGQAMYERKITRSRQAGDAPWYAERVAHTPENANQGSFDLQPGSATRMIDDAARREGVTPEQMSRATALTSPRTRWTKGTAGTDDFSTPNLTSARNVVKDTKIAKDVSEQLDLQVDYDEIGRHAPSGGSLSEAMGKAAVNFATSDPSKAIPVASLESQKVPNFDQSLLLSHPSQAVRKQAAMSYTVDTHDVTSLGSDERLLKTPGGHAIARMTGRRSALAHGELPPMGQSGVWEGQRSKTPEPMGAHSMLETKRGGKIGIRAEPELPHISEQFEDRRSPTAKRLGLEF